MKEAAAKLAKPSEPDLMQIAYEAAAAGDFAAMMNAVVDSHYLDGLYRYLKRDWNQFDDHDAAGLIGEALDEFYSKAKSGFKIWKPQNYIFKVLQKLVIDEHERKIALDPIDGLPEAEASRRAEAGANILINTVPRGDRVRAAIQIARQLVPNVGETRIQQVCNFYIDAVEKELPSVEDEALADTFGVPLETARRLKNRALQRLSREARKAGVKITEVFGTDIFKTKEEVDQEGMDE